LQSHSQQDQALAEALPQGSDERHLGGTDRSANQQTCLRGISQHALMGLIYRQLARRQMAKLHNSVQEIPFSRSQSIGARAIPMHDEPPLASGVCTVTVHIMGWRQPDGIGTSTDSTYRSWFPEGKRRPAVAVIARG
jgi:hypothetical protein